MEQYKFKHENLWTFPDKDAFQGTVYLARRSGWEAHQKAYKKAQKKGGEKNDD